MTVIAIIILSLITILLFVICPINVEFINTDSLPVYLAIIKALRLFNRPNNKDNRKHILNICSNGKHFTSDFCKFSNTQNYYTDISALSFIIYDYVQFKERTNKKELEKNYD